MRSLWAIFVCSHGDNSRDCVSLEPVRAAVGRLPVAANARPRYCSPPFGRESFCRIMMVHTVYITRL